MNYEFLPKKCLSVPSNPSRVLAVTGSLAENPLHSLIVASVQNPSQPGKIINTFLVLLFY